MKLMHTPLFILFAVIIMWTISLSPVRVFADTASPTQSTQLKVNSDGDILYVTMTAEDQTERNQSATTTTQNNSNIRNLGKDILVPKAYPSTLGELLTGLLPIIIVFAILLAFFYFILAGLQWITSGGDKGKTEEARNKIVHAFIGVIIVASTYALANFVAYILGFESLNGALMSIERIKLS